MLDETLKTRLCRPTSMEPAAIASRMMTATKNTLKQPGGLTIILIVLLLVFALCLSGANGYIFRTDELFSVSNMGGFDPPYSPAEIIHSISQFSPDHAPLFFLLGAGWASVAGWTQFALRMFAVLTSILMIACLYRYATDAFDYRTGLLSSFLMGASAYLVLHFHDFRMYPLLLLLAIVHSWLYWRLESGRASNRRNWILFVFSAISLVYTHTFSVILFAGLAAFHLILARKSKYFIKTWAGWAIAAMAYLPYFSTTLTALEQAAQIETVTTAAASIGELIGTFAHLLTNGVDWLLIPFGAPVLYALLRLRDRATARLMFLAIAMLLVPLALNELVGLIPLSRMRYFLILWFPFLLLFARGITLAPRWTLLAPILVIAWSIAGYQYYHSEDALLYIGGMSKTRNYPALDDYVRQLRDKVRSEDFLLGFARNFYLNHDHKHGKSVSDYYTQLQLGIDGAFVRGRAVGPWLVEEMKELIDGHPYLLFAYEPEAPPDGLEGAKHVMHSTYKACGVLVDSSNLYVQRFVDPALNCDQDYLRIEYENGIAIADRYVEFQPDAALLTILIGWDVPNQRLLNDFSFSLQVHSPQGEKVEQGHSDFYLHQFSRKWNRLNLPIAGIVPGEYRLVLILYNTESGKKVGGVDVNTGETGAILPILSFTVE